ncbi:hypothetical protein [Lysinibacillus sphaericus]|uniref:hypothetical protein n=1 Tax=Lysinibacillus sphaericus TaxID=1421 RepID=UPI001CBEB456|nr:hypothetical protein [Lysinibacillus sphaericus]
MPIGKQRWYRGNNSVFVLLYKDENAFLSSFSKFFLCESEASATNRFCVRKRSVSYKSFLCAKAKRQLQLRQGEIDFENWRF